MSPIAGDGRSRAAARHACKRVRGRSRSKRHRTCDDPTTDRVSERSRGHAQIVLVARLFLDALGSAAGARRSTLRRVDEDNAASSSSAANDMHRRIAQIAADGQEKRCRPSSGASGGRCCKRLWRVTRSTEGIRAERAQG